MADQVNPINKYLINLMRVFNLKFLEKRNPSMRKFTEMSLENIAALLKTQGMISFENEFASIC